MKAIMVMFDSLNRHMLPTYGGQWVHAPNFRRLAERTVQFNRSYVCSMPCMPARRELHTGRPNFLHRSWGPLEPFDDSMPEMLKKAGVHTHLATDHYHYFEDGGCTYHTKYNTWQFFRGQEGDAWMGQVAPPAIPECAAPRGPGDLLWKQDWINRQFLRTEADQPQPQTFAAGLDYIRRNHAADRWFLHIETFDPHEPFFTQRKYKDLYAKHYDEYQGRHFDWPPYRRVEETKQEVDHVRHEYAALMSMCDVYMGEVLDAMDEYDLWKDTMLIVNTDHGFLLGEHECYAKCWAPLYEEVARTPLFIWDPRCRKHGETRQSLVQTIDLAPTLLDYFGLKPTADMIGRSLRDTIQSDAPVRQAGIFGLHGGHVNVTDGRYVYMRAPTSHETQELCEYTLMPTHMRAQFSPDELRDKIDLAEPFSFTKGVRPMRIRCNRTWKISEGTLLFDLKNDPAQQKPLQNPAIERMMTDQLIQLLQDNEAPPEQYRRLGLG